MAGLDWFSDGVHVLVGLCIVLEMQCHAMHGRFPFGFPGTPLSLSGPVRKVSSLFSALLRCHLAHAVLCNHHLLRDKTRFLLCQRRRRRVLRTYSALVETVVASVASCNARVSFFFPRPTCQPAVTTSR